MIAATLCYIKSDDKTLMLHRIRKKNDIHEGKWNGLGGKFEKGETPEECVIREVKEESGLEILRPQLKGFITFPEFDGVNDWHVFVFTATRFSGHLIDCEEGKLEWIKDEDILNLNLWDGDRFFLPWLQRDDFFSARFIYKEKILTEHEVCFYPLS
jgi:8-oxo-dGTP diphosphatase